MAKTEIRFFACKCGQLVTTLENNTFKKCHLCDEYPLTEFDPPFKKQ